MNRFLRIFRDPSDGGGGGSATAVAPSPAAAPAPAVATPAAASASPPAGGAPAATGQPAAAASAPAAGGAGQPAAAPAFKSALEGLPARNSPDYQKAFAALPLERQQAVETELFDRLQNPAKYAELDKPAATPAATPAAEGGEPAEVFLTQEEFDALPPNAQAVVTRMQKVIGEVEPYIGDGQLAKGMEMMIANPVIKAEMARMSGAEDPYAMPPELEAAFDPSKIVSPKDLEKLDFQLKPDEAKGTLADLLLKAFEQGARQSTMKAEVKTQQQVALVKRVNLFEKQLNDLQVTHPSLKSDLPLRDPNHPLKPYLQWAHSNLGDHWLEKNGQAVGYAAYLAATGGMNKAMENVAKNTRLQFIRSIENGEKQVATMGRGAPAATPAKTVMDGIDLDKYKADPAYRTSSYNSAPQNVRMKLEQWISTGKIPT